jgi:hypothetical protein
MKRVDCGAARDLLPLVARGGLPAHVAAAVKAHAETCRECAVEAAVVRLLADATWPAPEGLEARIREAVHARPRARWSAWRVAALAATLAAAVVGGRILLERHGPAPDEDTLAVHAPAAGVTAAPASWAIELDPLLRDAAALELLSLEELELVLAELGP